MINHQQENDSYIDDEVDENIVYAKREVDINQIN